MTHPATLLRNSWYAYFRNIKTWLALVLPLAVLVAIFVIVSYIINGDTTQIQTLNLPVAKIRATVALLIFTVLAAIFVVRTMMNAAIYSAAKALNNEKTSFKEAYRQGLKTFWPVLWVSVLRGLLIFAGLLLLIVPGVFWALRYSLTTQAIVVEGKRGMAALRRSKELTDGRLLETLIDFGVLGTIIGYGTWIAMIVVMVVIMVFGSIVSFAIPASAYDIASNITSMTVALAWAAIVWLAIPFSPLALTSIYKDFSSK
jgi:hypothetical protein